MSDDKLDDSVLQALRQGLCGRRALPETRTPKDSVPEEARAMEMAAYLDGSLDRDAAEAFEATLLAEDERLELLLASRAALAETPDPSLPAAVAEHAQALVAPPQRIPAQRIPDQANKGPSLAARLADWVSTPWRPALGAAAFGLYAFFCVQVFDLGLAGGEELAAVVAPELSLADSGFGLSLDDIM